VAPVPPPAARAAIAHTTHEASAVPPCCRQPGLSPPPAGVDNRSWTTADTKRRSPAVGEHGITLDGHTRQRFVPRGVCAPDSARHAQRSPHSQQHRVLVAFGNTGEHGTHALDAEARHKCDNTLPSQKPGKPKNNVMVQPSAQWCRCLRSAPLTLRGRQRSNALARRAERSSPTGPHCRTRLLRRGRTLLTPFVRAAVRGGDSGPPLQPPKRSPKAACPTCFIAARPGAPPLRTGPLKGLTTTVPRHSNCLHTFIAWCRTREPRRR